MNRWTKDVFRWISPHHFIEIFRKPRRAVRELKYRYGFTSKSRFIIDILSAEKNRVSDVFNELKESDFVSSLYPKMNNHQISSGRGPMGAEAEILYACVRIKKPRLVLETGVGAGYSSAFILNALKQNNFGFLHSIDFHEEGESCGWLIPDNLKDRWELVKGYSNQVLGPLLKKMGFVDVFIHDSDHSYENMMFEFRAVWPYLTAGGVFMAHDVGRNDALFDFLKEVGFPWWKVRTLPVLAGLQKK